MTDRRYRTVPAELGEPATGERAAALRRDAKIAVAVALRRGHLVRGRCARCEDPDTRAHHPRGYEPQRWLDVEWLCQTHDSV